MSTQPLYYHDPYLAEFTATIVESFQDEEGSWVVLDQTAFYPEGGGQPWDGGTLDGTAVRAVKKSDGRILHLVDASLPLGPCKGAIDWEGRFDHMQQHTGQHLLSALFHDRLNAPTVSFHLGASLCTIDLRRGALSEGEATAIEEEANRIIWENRPVTPTWPDEETLQGLPLRKETDVEGPKRLVTIAGCDYSLCGGTHVRSTGELGLLKIRRWERNKGDTMRVEFLAGGRAYRDYAWKHRVISTLAREYGAADTELETLVLKQKAEVLDNFKRFQALNLELLQFRAIQAVAETPLERGIRRIFRETTGLSSQELKIFALKMVEHPATLAGLVQFQKGNLTFLLARSTDISVPCGEIISEMCQHFGGRGGGRPDLAQGGAEGTQADVARALDCFKDHPAITSASKS